MAKRLKRFKKKRKEKNYSNIAAITFVSIATILAYPETTVKVSAYVFTVIVLLLIAYLLYRFSAYKFSFGNRSLNPNMVDVDCMDGIEFEHFLKPLFEAKGYDAKVTQGSGDYGADLILTRKGKKTVVQAKCYSSNIGISAIQQAVAAIPYYHANNAMVVTNQYYTKQAKKLAKANRVQLIDRDELTDMITDLKGGKTSVFNRLLAPFKLRLGRD